MDQPPRETSSGSARVPPRRQRWITVALLFLCFCVDSAVRTPVPAVNEPHYLAKAKHYWNPDWGRGDLFLESSNPHLVFYATVGVLTKWLTLPQTAWIARLVALLLVAIGIESLLSTVLHGARAIVAAAILYLGLAAVGNLAGEWIVGGVEGKVFAYGFAFWGAGCAARGQWIRCGGLLGLAVSFHPVVGVWCLFATLCAVVVARWYSPPDASSPRTPLKWSSLLCAAAVFALCAAPGLWAAFQMLGNAPAKTALLADEIQVFRRLKHHLDPATFSPLAYGCYAAMLIAWFVLRRRVRDWPGGPFFHGYLMGSTVIAAGGLVAGFILRSAPLMKFYPFRLIDVLLPLAISVLAVRLFQQRWTALADRGASLLWMRIFGVASCAVAAAYALLIMPVDRDPSRLHPEVRADWVACCRWISAETPGDVQVLTPSYSWGFKWYGGRAEYVNYKDCPQDAESLLEWERRYDALWNWEASRKAGTMSRATVERFPDHELVDFIIARTNDATDLPVVYRGTYFSVYDVRRQN